MERITSQVQSNIAKTARVDRVTDQNESAVDDLLEDDRRQGSASAHSVGHGAELRRSPSRLSEASGKLPVSPSITDARSILPGEQSADLSRVTRPAETREGCDSEEDDVDTDFDVHGFAHPSTYTEQPWIWVPKDELGISQVLVQELRESGVEASDEGASIDAGGTVEVQRAPPDEEWSGGHDA